MPQREDAVNLEIHGVQASTLLCMCKMRQVFADVSLPEKATVQLGGVGTHAAFRNHISAVSGEVTVTHCGCSTGDS